MNAQIATGGTSRVNSGVGFAIPADVVRRVVPVLIESGAYAWPWLGVEGGDVGLRILEANDLVSQRGAYIDVVRANGPADEAGLQGSTGSREIRGVSVPTGGDIVVAANGEPVADFDALLEKIAFSSPGDEITLTILRDGERQEVTVTLEARPAGFRP